MSLRGRMAAGGLLGATLVYATFVGVGVIPRYDGLIFFMLCVWAAHAEIHASSSRRALYIAFLGIVTVGGLVNMWWSYGGVGGSPGSPRRRHSLVRRGWIPFGRHAAKLWTLAQRGRKKANLPRRPVRPPSRDRLQRARHRRTDGPRLHGSRSAGGVAHRRPRRPVGGERWRSSFSIRSSVVTPSHCRPNLSGFFSARPPSWRSSSRPPQRSKSSRETILFALGLATRMGPLFVVATTVVFFAVRRQ